MMKIDSEGWVIDDEIEFEIVTLESPVNGIMLMGISLDKANKSVYITSLHFNTDDLSDLQGVLKSGKESAIIESFLSLELAEQFYNEIKHPLKLADFIRGKGN